jgi:hypothetical protein
VQRWLGHHSPSFTLDTYIHLLPDRQPEPVDLDAELARGEVPSTLPMDGCIGAGPQTAPAGGEGSPGIL